MQTGPKVKMFHTYYVLKAVYTNTWIKLMQLNKLSQVSYYTPCPEKKSLGYFRHNIIKYWPILNILSLLQSAENLQ